MKLSVIVPTLGRQTLPRTLDSIVWQLNPGDELLVVSDGWISHVADQVSHYQSHEHPYYVSYHRGPTTMNNGASQRDLGIERALGDVLLFMDDDDIYARGALESIRLRIKDSYGMPHIFQMRYGNQGGVLWREPKFEFGNVGTPMFTVPRLPSLPKWASYPKNAHDFHFINDVVNKMFGGHVGWHNIVTSIIRPSAEEAEREIPRAEV
jgi:glycosyltransferase involved in cell wall biosynthesis